MKSPAGRGIHTATDRGIPFAISYRVKAGCAAYLFQDATERVNVRGDCRRASGNPFGRKIAGVSD
jgi:hypothetical protein